jgi:hypothetical protein
VTRPAVPDATEDPWAQLPPLPGFVPGVRKTEGAAALVEAATVERQPMVLAGPRGRGKAVAVLSGDLWRLDLISSGAGANPRTVRSFWRDAVRWLALPEPAGRVRTTTSRLVYRGGEQVAVAAQVYDELLRPQERATVQVLLAGREGPVLQLLDRGGGQYDGTMAGLPPGDYHYSAQAYLGDTMVGQDEGRFLVEPYDLESVDVAVRPPLLEEIAAAGGGLSRPLSDWRQITGRLALAPRLVEESRAFPLWGRWWALAIVLALLSAEWILRQRAGML